MNDVKHFARCLCAALFAAMLLAACGSSRPIAAPVPTDTLISSTGSQARNGEGAARGKFLIATKRDSLSQPYTLSRTSSDSLSQRDSLSGGEGRRGVATLDSTAKKDSLSAPRNDGALDTTITYSARDSVVYDLTGKRMYLYGDGKISYQEFRLVAPDIEVNTEENTLSAKSDYDSTGKPLHQTAFRDAGGEYVAEKMTYNFKTKRGKIALASTKIDDGYYRGAKIKRTEDGALFVEDGIYTTCNHPVPHYYFYARQMKIVPGDRIFARPIVLYIEGVPLFALPFIFFPSQSGRTSGVVVPRYGFDLFKGYYLAQGGYYWAISDYMDLLVDGDWGTRGSWRLGSRFQYNKRYEFNGTLSGYFEKLFFNEDTDLDFRSQENWDIALQHSQEFDPTFSANLNLRFHGGNIFSLNTTNPIDIISQDVSSSASLTKTFAEGQRSLSLSYARSQNLQTNDIGQNATLNLYQGQFFPFRQRRGGGDAFLEKIGLAPSANLNVATQNRTDFFSTSLGFSTGFSIAVQQIFSPDFQATFTQGFTLSANTLHISPVSDLSGATLNTPFSINGTALRYLIYSASLGLTQNYVDRTVSKFYDESTRSVQTVVNKGFAQFSTYNLTASLQTRLYGIANTTWLEELTGIKSFRHTFVPSVSYTYTPDFSAERFGYFAFYTDSLGQRIKYNRYEGASLLPPAGESQSMSVSIQNIFDAKVRTLDTTKAIDDPLRNEKVIASFLNVGLSSSYNFAAEQFRLAPLNISASSNTLSPYLSLSASAVYDFYSFDSLGTRINRFLASDKGYPARLTSLNLQLSSSLRGERKSNPDRLTSASDSIRIAVEDSLRRLSGLFINDQGRNAANNVTDFDIPWQLTVNANISVNNQNPVAPSVIDATLFGTLGVSPTPNWRVDLNGGYSFRDRRFTFPTISVSRDLHCWQMSFQWTPVGTFRSYFFTINLKAPQLRDIRVERRDAPRDYFPAR